MTEEDLNKGNFIKNKISKVNHLKLSIAKRESVWLNELMEIFPDFIDVLDGKLIDYEKEFKDL